MGSNAFPWKLKHTHSIVMGHAAAQASTTDDLRGFNLDGYALAKAQSTETKLVFTRGKVAATAATAKSKKAPRSEEAPAGKRAKKASVQKKEAQTLKKEDVPPKTTDAPPALRRSRRGDK